MDAIILAAGQGVRLRPITYTTPKGLIPINGVKILDNLVAKLYELKVKSVHLLTNKYFYSMYQQRKKTYTGALNVQIVMLKDSPKHTKGTMRSIWYLVKKFKLKEDLLVCGIDQMFDFSLLPAYKLFQQKQQPVIVSYNTHDWEISTHHSIITYNEATQRIRLLFPKSTTPRDTLCITFLLFFPPKVISLISKYLNEGKNPDNVAHFLTRIKRSVPLYTHEVKNKKRFDIGNYYSLYKAKKAFGETQVTLERLQKGLIK